MFPIVIYVNHNALAELEASEWGSFEDAGGALDTADEITKAPHVVNILRRHGNRIVVKDEAEARTVYIAVCSGTFQQQTDAFKKTAERICDKLRRFCTAADIKLWPNPTGL